MSEIEYSHGISSYPITQVSEKPTNKTVISNDRYPSCNSEIVESRYPSNDSHHSVKKKSPAEKILQENQIGLPRANDRERSEGINKIP